MDGNQVNKDGKAGADGERRRELSAMLWDLVERETRAGTARLLGVDRKTVRRALDSGNITDHMAAALERLLGGGGGKEEIEETPEEGNLEERVEQLKGDVAELRETFETLNRPVGGTGADARGDEEAVGLGDEEMGGSGDTEFKDLDANLGDAMTSDAVPSVEGLSVRPRAKLRREDPELVTEAPAQDDPEVYGAAWPLVEEWRRLREGHPSQGKTMSWLLTQERLLVLELAMLEEHGLTLPPETQPLRGFGRRGQTRWRHRALHDTREAIRKRKMLRWVRRVLTLGIWWK